MIKTSNRNGVALMDERRRKNRSNLDAQLVIKRLGGAEMREVSISVTNISTTGLGFMCTQELEMGAVYEGILTIWTKEKIPVFLEIVRVKPVGDKYNCGAFFVGMPEMLTNRIAAYQVIEQVYGQHPEE